MVDILQIVALILVVVAMVPALAHALELPGKLRLSKDAYFTVQPIYYPGFTFAGFAEPAAIIATAGLWYMAPAGGTDSALTLAALLGLVAMHAVYWLFTHPVNDFWLQGEKLGRLGAGFFSIGSKREGTKDQPLPWTALRDRWEYSHVVRAGLAFASFLALVVAIATAGGE
jgi:hypothetical protein